MAQWEIHTVDEWLAQIKAKHAAHLKYGQERLDIAPLIEQFGTWAVTEYGLECLTRSYAIEGHRIGGNPIDYVDGSGAWVHHMSEKNWVVMSDFIEAYRFAAKHFEKAWKRSRRQAMRRLKLRQMQS